MSPNMWGGVGSSWGSSSNENDGARDGDGDGEDDLEAIFHADHIMLLVDVRAPMLERNAAGHSHLEDTIGVLLHIMKQKTTARDNSAIGIIFLGTGKTTNDHHYVEVLPLKVPSAVPIRKLQALLDNFEHEFQQQFGGSQDESIDYFPLKEALWKSGYAFQEKASSNKLHQNQKRAWVFSNDDDPNAQMKQNQEALQQVVRDLAGGGMELSLWCIDRSPEQPFRVEQFYHALLATDDGDDGAGQTGDPEAQDTEDGGSGLSERVMRAKASGFDIISNRFKAKYYKKRVAHHGFLDLGLRRLGGVKGAADGEGSGAPSNNAAGAACAPGRIGVQFFIDLKVAKRPAPMKLYSKNNEPVKSNVAYLCKDTAETVPEHEIRTFVAFGNDSMPLVQMNKQEMLEVRAPVACARTHYEVASRGVGTEVDSKSAIIDTAASGAFSSSNSSIDFCDIEVLYFAPTSQLRPELNIKEPLFIFPDESGVQGSTVLFAALVQDLSRKGLMAMVRFNGHKPGAKEPRLAAMLPQLEELAEDGDQVQPAGFQLIILPFRNEIRAAPQDVPASVLSVLDQQPELVDYAEGVVASLAVQIHDEQTGVPVFDYQSVPSPALQQFHAVLQAVALRESEYSWSQADDKMVPDYSYHAHAASATQAFKDALNMPDDAGSIALGKRPTGGTGPNSAAAKKARAEAVETETIQTILAHIASNPDSIKLDGLKEFCRMLSLPLSGKKDALIERIVTGAEKMLTARGVSIK